VVQGDLLLGRIIALLWKSAGCRGRTLLTRRSGVTGRDEVVRCSIIAQVHCNGISWHPAL
jgi:hypothetical protein